MQPDLFSQLQDIHTPQAVGWWPLAWGWWCLIALLLVVTVILIRAIFKHFKLRQAKKAALQALADIEVDSTPIAQVKAINNILKRVVLAYCNRDEVAQLTGSKWASWLNDRCKKGPAFDATLISLAYQPTCNEEQAQRFKQQAIAWITNNLPITDATGGKHV